VDVTGVKEAREEKVSLIACGCQKKQTSAPVREQLENRGMHAEAGTSGDVRIDMDAMITREQLNR
jgi:hypothetical protein